VSEKRFPVGAVVYLKSGSPAMTVTTLNYPNQNTIVEVEWFVGGDLKRDAFLVDSLTDDPNVVAKYYA
jgi:uncharacterized protein YodC (DUF2158 family)